MRAFFTIESFAGRVIDTVGAGDRAPRVRATCDGGTKNDVIASILAAWLPGVGAEADGKWAVVLPNQI